MLRPLLAQRARLREVPRQPGSHPAFLRQHLEGFCQRRIGIARDFRVVEERRSTSVRRKTSPCPPGRPRGRWPSPTLHLNMGNRASVCAVGKAFVHRDVATHMHLCSLGPLSARVLTSNGAMGSPMACRTTVPSAESGLAGAVATGVQRGAGCRRSDTSGNQGQPASRFARLWQSPFSARPDDTPGIGVWLRSKAQVPDHVSGTPAGKPASSAPRQGAQRGKPGQAPAGPSRSRGESRFSAAPSATPRSAQKIRPAFGGPYRTLGIKDSNLD